MKKIKIPIIRESKQKFIKENTETQTISFEEFKIQVTNLQNIHSLLMTRSTTIQQIKTKYNMLYKVPKTLLALFAFEGYHITFDDNSTLRILTLDEILNIEKEYKIDCVKKQCIPIIDYFDNNYVVYDLEERQYRSMNIENGEKINYLPKNMKDMLDVLRVNNIREDNNTNIKISSTSTSSYLEIDPKFIENEMIENENFIEDYFQEEETEVLAKLKKYIEENKDNVTITGGVTDKQIEKAETQLGFSFSPEMKEYLSVFGSIDCGSVEFNGLGNKVDKPLNIVLQTKEAREKDSKFPANHIVFQSGGDGHLFFTVDDKNNMYKYIVETKISLQKLPIKFENYILSKLKENEKKIEETVIKKRS